MLLPEEALKGITDRIRLVRCVSVTSKTLSADAT